MIFIHDLCCRLRFSLFIFQWTVQKHYTWILNITTHTSMSDIFVQHNPVQYFRFFDLAAGNLEEKFIIETHSKPFSIHEPIDTLNTFSTRAYLLMSTSRFPSSSFVTVLTASKANLH